MIKWLKKLRIRRRWCDHCGRFNPPPLDGNARLCGACAIPGGLYRASHAINGVQYGAVGKVSWVTLQFPIKWRGWWRIGQ